MKKIWFTSDPHYSHENIIRLCNRDFVDIYEHDKILIENYNSLVSDTDDCYFLGDLAYRCSPERVSEILNKLNGKIYCLLGNHDKPLIQAVQKGLLNDILNNGKLEIFGLKSIIKDRTISIAKMIEINNQKIFISHYALRTFPCAFRGAYHLFGHSHGRIISKYKIMDVGVDSTEIPRKYFPVSFDEIREIMKIKSQNFSEVFELQEK